MNVYCRKSDNDMTEIICGVEEVKPVLRWMTEKLGGKVTSDDVVVVSLIPTESLVKRAMDQAEMKV